MDLRRTDECLLRRTDECNKFYPIRLSVATIDCSMVADADAVGGEAWTCDGQTNAINFIQFVSPSPRLLDGSESLANRLSVDQVVSSALNSDHGLRITDDSYHFS
jgi:hypothetical protein